MPRIAGEPLLKVTFNLYAADVAWFKDRHGFGYTEAIRAIIHKHVQDDGKAKEEIWDGWR